MSSAQIRALGGLRPTRVACVDGALMFGTGAIAMHGFHSTFAGWSYFAAALTGLVLGIVLAHLANVLGEPVIVLAVFSVAAFFLLGGAVALHGSSASAALPLPSTLNQLADASVHGWKDLLTTLPPVDDGPLLALPYLLGLVAGAGGIALAGRTRSSLAPVVAPVVLLAAVILLGVQTPSQTLVQGGLFAAASVAWICLRVARKRAPVRSGSGHRIRIATAVVLVGAAAAAATVVAPHLPGAASHDRVVLRSYVTPPFNIGQYASPLSSFRRYTKPNKARLYDQPLFTVTDLPANTRIRFAALDSYNGVVWGAVNQPDTSDAVADTFQKVGSVIANPMQGKQVTAHVTIAKGYQGVWLPTAGGLKGITFDGAQATERSNEFRYNLATDTAVLPSGISAGDSYTFTAVLPDDKLSSSAAAGAEGTAPTDEGGPFRTLAVKWGGSAATPLQQVLSIAGYLRDTGRYTDGGPGQEQYPPGHYLTRLAQFVAPGQEIAGDDEQYAAMMALLANQMNVPARVVMGAQVPASGVVTGKDVQAWVEIRVADGSWRTLPTDAFMRKDKAPDQQPPVPQQQEVGKVIPPPVPIRPPSVVGDASSDELDRTARSHGHQSAEVSGLVGALATYVGLPLLLISLGLGFVIGAKSWRRRRRRSRGLPVTRLSRGWRDLLDHARDLGHHVPAAATRREQAATIGLADLPPLARAADAHVFGAGDPSNDDARSYWAEVDAARRRMTSAASLTRRWRAAVSLASFRKPDRGPARGHS